MTKIMKGGLSYCATSNMVALTQAQYDALSTNKYACVLVSTLTLTNINIPNLLSLY